MTSNPVEQALAALLPDTVTVVASSSPDPAFSLLAAETVDYLLTTTIVNTSKGAGGADLADLKGLSIPVRVSGTFSDPSYSPDLGAVLSDKVKQKAKEKIDEKIEEKLGDKLKDKLGGKGGDLLKGLFGK